MPPRLKDIAEATGINIGTVSHVLNRHPKADCLRPETREKILRTANELGYCRNELASSVARKHGNVLALISEDMGCIDYTGRIQNGVLDEAATHDYAVIVCHLKEQNHDEIVRKIVGWRSAGVIFHISMLSHASGIMNVLSKQGIPYGTANLNNPTGIGVTTDDIGGMRLAVEHLAKHRCRKPVFFTYPDKKTHAEYLLKREDGFQRALKEFYPSSEMIEYCLPVENSKYNHQMRDLFQQLKSVGCDGVVCASDMLAIELLRMGAATGVRIPDDLSITGYGDLNIASSVFPRLTTLSQNFEELGSMTTHIVIEAIKARSISREKCNVVLPVRLVVRESVKKDTI